ncbi:MAG: hypothetical protein JKX85_05125 [Phycisphaeraceae bacterium]|nr:hypothetical protein [Phycisphaeraceae bacterium]
MPDGPLRYLYVDMNSYFASVEQQENAALRGRPVAVIPTDTDRTCCIAASYEAKWVGVKTGTPVWQAREICPTIELVLARPRLYVQYHHRIIDAVESCLHVDQVSSIDEMYGKLMGDERQPANAIALANKVKTAIRDAVGESVRCSVGLAPNCWLAKVATDMQKPDGLVAILPDEIPTKLYPLKLRDLPGIGKGMSRRLERHRVQTVEQLCQLSLKQMQDIWESKVMADIWWAQLHGQDLPSRPTRRRTVSHSHVLAPKSRTDPGARAVMARMIHKAATRMRSLGYWAQHMQMTVKHVDSPSWTVKVSLGASGGSNDTLVMVQKMSELWPTRHAGVPIQVMVLLYDMVPENSVAPSLFEEPRKQAELAVTMDKINKKYGRHAAFLGAMWGAQESAPTRISFTQVPKDSDWD